MEGIERGIRGRFGLASRRGCREGLCERMRSFQCYEIVISSPYTNWYV